MPNRPLNEEYADLLGDEPDSALLHLIRDLDALYTSARPPAAGLWAGTGPNSDEQRGRDSHVRSGQVTASPVALPRRSWFRYAGEIAAALFVVALVAGAMALLIGNRSPASDAPRSGIEQSRDASTFAIRPVAGSTISGSVITERMANGDVRLRATVQGGSREVYGPNLMWIVATDTCAGWRGAYDSHANSGAILWRDDPLADQPGLQHFSVVIPAKDANPPLTLFAFKNGGGPIVACADITDLPQTESGGQVITLPAASEQYDAAGDRIVLHLASQPPAVSQQAAMDVVTAQYPSGPWEQPDTAPDSARTVRAWYGVVSIEKPSQNGWWSSEGETLVWLIDYEYEASPSPSQMATGTSAPAFAHVLYAVDIEARKVAWWHPYGA